MLIAGFNKTSFLDYPGTVCAVVFTPACNFDCWYCHNRHILRTQGLKLIGEGTVLEHLEKRKGLLEGLVVTGGEPTLQKDLASFLRAVKKLGYLIKLDTNGSHPEVVRCLLGEGLLDYIAMDIKAPLAKYESIIRTAVDTDTLRESIGMLTTADIPYEFRTTFAPTLTQEDILAICDDIKGAKAYWLQQYRIPQDFKVPVSLAPHSKELVLETAVKVRDKLGVCDVRGID